MRYTMIVFPTARSSIFTKLMFVALVLSCGPVARPVVPANGSQIYDAMLQRYASAKTYSDRGEVTVELVRGKDLDREQLSFTTSYVHDDQLRFEMTVEHDPNQTLELWSNKTHTYIKAFFNDSIVDYGADVIAALHAPAGITAGLTSEVPLALLDKHPRPTAIEVVPNTGPVWELKATFGGADVELFIDRESLVLKRIERVQRTTPTASRPVVVTIKTTITYTAVLDGIVTAAMLAPPALTLPIVPDGPPAWLGILTDPKSSRVQQVIAGAPADVAGVKVGDEVVSIDGHAVTTGQDVVANAHKLRAEQKAPIVVKRNGTVVPLTVVAKARPDPAQLQAKAIGNPAPPFALHGLDGKTIELASLRGQVVVVDFWATWCKPCAITTPHLDQLAKAHPVLHVIGISDEDRDDVTAYLAKHPVSYPQALDARDEATRDYLIQGLPTVYVIDKTGVVRYTAVGVPDFDELDAAIGELLK
ncbi:MAG: redoxin domain-containing protein [Kofleriaceae bacterium]